MPKKSQTVELADIGVEYDAVHISGDEDLIYEYEEEHYDSVFGADWRCDFDELFNDVNSRFSDREVEVEEGPSGYKFTVVCGDKRASVRSYYRVEILKAMDRVLKGAPEEMRVLADSLRGDTVSIMVKPTEWWKTMEKHYKKEMKATYIKLKDVKIID